MSVIGILTCEVLEQEIAYVLATDADVEQIVVVENIRSTRLIKALQSRGVCNLQCIPREASFHQDLSTPFTVLVRVLEIGLHRNRKTLQRALHSAAHELAPHVDALLLGYGLCGNALADAESVLDVPVPIFMPMDHGHAVDDCIALSLGGRSRYCQEQHHTPGTFFLTPGWSYHWRKTFDDMASLRSNLGKRIFAHYTRSLLISNPAMSEEEMRRNSAEFSTALELRVEACSGTLHLLNVAWESAKDFVTAPAGIDRETPCCTGGESCD